MSNAELATAVVATARAMNASGINRGTAGNVSARSAGGKDFLITPTGMAYDEIDGSDIVQMHLDGSWQGARKPSSEWRFHRDIYAARPDTGAVIHTHSSFATALACMGCNVPPFHYMSACLLAHHGMIVCARELKDALALAVEFETLCEQYWRVLQIGAPRLLPDDEMERVLEKFAGYGQQ